MSFENLTQDQIFDILKQAKTIAIVGLSNKPDRTSYEVAKYIQEKGYTIIPVNPVLVGEEILGEKVYASLEEIPVHMDIVDVFRRSEFLPEVAESFLKVDASVFWAQLGLENEEAAHMIAEAGNRQVVMDRCIKIELEKMNG